MGGYSGSVEPRGELLNHFLHRFQSELDGTLKQGFLYMYDGQEYLVKGSIGLESCDTPACAVLFNHVKFNGNYSCILCEGK